MNETATIYHVLYNPLAGNLQGKLPPLLAELEQAGHSAVAHDITAVTDYASFLDTLTPEDTLILSGGDGTINRFINDTEGLTIPCPLLYVPRGTGNDFLRDVDRAGRTEPFPLTPYVTDLPYVEVKGKRCRFLNNVGFGIDGYCCEVGDAQKAARTGKGDKPVNYTAIAIKGLLFHFKPTNATVIVDGQTYTYKKVWLAPTMKGRYYGGGMIATPDQDRNAPDGKLSVMVFHDSSSLKTLMIFPSIFKGEHIKSTRYVTVHTGYDIRVIFDSPRAVQIDGETVVGVTEYHAYAAHLAPRASEEEREAEATV